MIKRYNAAAAGDRFAARVDTYGPDFRIWLLEAGVKHRADRSTDGSWELQIERGLSPAQGSIPGVHHVVADSDGSVWTCERAARVARIDGHEKRVVAVADVARAASHLALDSGRGRLFLADAGNDRIIALRASDLKPEAQWSAPGMPQLPLVAPDGTVCVTGGASGTLTIARPQMKGYAVQTVSIGRCPHESVLTTDGGHLFVSCTGDGELAKVRPADGNILGRCAVGDGPAHLARHPDGSRIYCTNSWDGTVSCITVDGERVKQAASGGWAHAIEVTPDGRCVYVANFLDDTLAVFDADTLERVALLPTEAYPHGLDVSPDGRYVVATGFASDYIRVYDAGAHVELARIEVGRGSSHTAFLTDAGLAFVGCSVSDHVAAVALAARKLLARIKVRE